MRNTKVVNLGVVFLTLLLLLMVNPVSAEVKKDEAAKSNQALAAMEKININKADAGTLTTLKGIGKDRAQKIIEYREKNGLFQKPEDLMNIKGIGRKIFEQNKDFITI